jgi:two-component system sensor histidine kinase HydH
MRFPSSSVRLVIVPAGVLAVALVATAFLASRSLRQRDAAVREGILVRAGHDLETTLRESSPSEADGVLRAFVAENSTTLDGIEVIGPNGPIASTGRLGSETFEMPAALGREWRSLVGPGGGGRGRGMGGPGMAPFRLRFSPSASLGREGLLASVVVGGGVFASLALVGLSFFAARGLEQRQRLQATEAEKRRLAAVSLAGAGLAHQVRNPLAVIKGTAQLLEEKLSGQERERAGRIVASSERIEALLSRLLDFARPLQAEPETLDLAGLARQVGQRSVPPSEVSAFGPSPALVDREQAESILEEFLANAHSFDPGGEIEIAVRTEKGFAVLEVLDRGPGPGVDGERAFDPYVTSRPDGTGLGLAIVKMLAEANGGSASLAPRPGGGTIASFRVPSGAN